MHVCLKENKNTPYRSSYLPNEILWGHRFESMVLYRKDHNKFQVNFSAFNSTYEVQEWKLCNYYGSKMFFLLKINIFGAIVSKFILCPIFLNEKKMFFPNIFSQSSPWFRGWDPQLLSAGPWALLRSETVTGEEVLINDGNYRFRNWLLIFILN